MAEKHATGSQTLSRGIRILEILADAHDPLSIDAIAEQLDVHRSIAYRLLRTLEDHRLVVRDATGRIVLGARMAALASGVASDLQAEALPELTAIANELGMTCLLAVMDRAECITLVSVEPRHAIASVAQRPGSHHSLAVGAPSKALLAQMPEHEWPVDTSPTFRADVRATRERGHATSHDEVIPTVTSVAVPLPLRGHRPACIAVVHVATELTDVEIAARMRRSVDVITLAMGG